MRTITITAALLAILIAGGYFWRQADRAATARAEILAEPYSEDDSVTVSFSAGGIFNQDVRVVAYSFGSEDQTIEDVYSDQILHDKLGKAFYEQGFRRVRLPGSKIFRPILIEPQSAATQKKPIGGTVGAVFRDEPAALVLARIEFMLSFSRSPNEVPEEPDRVQHQIEGIHA